MDEIDFTISFMLMANSRISYSKIADQFNMSVNSIYKRIKSKVELGIIRSFKTRLSFLNFPNTTNIVLFGNSPIKEKKILMDKIGNNECIYNVTQASGELFYFHAYSRNLKDLDAIISLIRKVAKINDLMVGLDKNSPSATIDGTIEAFYTDKDYLIINSLRNNSRKTISDIADEVGFSSKTVTRRLNRLIDENLIEFTIDWYPDKTSEILSFIIIKSKPSKYFEELNLMENIRNKFGQKVLYPWKFTNLPNLMIILCWANTMKELQEIEAYLIEMDLEKVEVTVLIEGKIYQTWLDTYLDEKIKQINK